MRYLEPRCRVVRLSRRTPDSFQEWTEVILRNLPEEEAHREADALQRSSDGLGRYAVLPDID